MAEASNSSRAEINPNGALHPEAATLFAQVAKGDLTAQRRVRQAWMDTLKEGAPQFENEDLLAATGVLVARLCAANGEIADAHVLAVALLNAGMRHHDGGRISLGWDLAAEALSLFQRLTAAGDQEAAETMDALVPHMPPEVVGRAQYYAKRETENV